MKTTRVATWLAAAFCCLLPFLAGGCAGTEPSRFYVLTYQTVQKEAQWDLKDVSVAVGPVLFPQYLDRPQIVTRSTPEIVQFAGFDRWAEPLDKNFARVLAENLSALIASDKVSLFSRPGAQKAEYQVEVEVTRFDGVRGGKATLAARYTILRGDGKDAPLIRKSEIHEPVTGPSFEALVAAQSRAVAALSGEIASAIAALSDQKGR
jgi:uncharacterized lipoprotein YmbA